MPAQTIIRGNIAFASGDNKTVEKFSDPIVINTGDTNALSTFYLAIEKPALDAVGNLTVTVYNRVAIIVNTVRDVPHTTHTVEMISSSPTYKGFLIQGLFLGTGEIKIGMRFATTTASAITVSYKVMQL